MFFSYRPTRTPRSIGLHLDGDGSEDEDSDLDESDTTETDTETDSTATGSTAATETDTTSIGTTATTASASGRETTTTAGSTADSTSLQISDVAPTSVGDLSSVESSVRSSVQSSVQSSATDLSSGVSSASTGLTTASELHRKNCQRDFATSNPREGKETDGMKGKKKAATKCVLSYSSGNNPRLKSPYTEQNTDLDGTPVSARSVSSITLPAPGTTLIRYDSSVGAYVPKEVSSSENVDTQYGDESDEERASIGSDIEDEDAIDNSSDNQYSNAQCQTGLRAGDSLHTLGNDKWQSPTNMLCYASLCNGEAAVQVKTPDLLSVPSSSDDEGYQPQDQMSLSSDECLADIPKSAADFMTKYGASVKGRPVSGVASEDSGLPRCDSAGSWVGLSRPSSATSMMARVGSAGHFHTPNVSTLYGDNTSSSDNGGANNADTPKHNKNSSFSLGDDSDSGDNTLDPSTKSSGGGGRKKQNGASVTSDTSGPVDGDQKQGSNHP